LEFGDCNFIPFNDSDCLYVGRTADLKRRIKEHLQGKNRTTNRHKSKKLIFYEAFLDKKDSIRRERYFKTSKGRKSL